MHGFYSEFQAILLCYNYYCIIAYQTISGFSFLWGGSVPVDLFFWFLLIRQKYPYSNIHNNQSTNLQNTVHTPYFWLISW